MVAEQRCSMASAEMAEYLQRVGAQPSELLVEEWNLLPLVYKNASGSRRAAWRVVITSVEQKEKFKGKEQLVSHAREYVAKVEGELQKIHDGIRALMDKKLVPSPSTDESKAFYYKMIPCRICNRRCKEQSLRRCLFRLCGSHQDCRERLGRDTSCSFGHGTEFLCLPT